MTGREDFVFVRANDNWKIFCVVSVEVVEPSSRLCRKPLERPSNALIVSSLRSWEGGRLSIMASHENPIYFTKNILLTFSGNESVNHVD